MTGRTTISRARQRLREAVEDATVERMVLDGAGLAEIAAAYGLSQATARKEVAIRALKEQRRLRLEQERRRQAEQRSVAARGRRQERIDIIRRVIAANGALSDASRELGIHLSGASRLARQAGIVVPRQPRPDLRTGRPISAARQRLRSAVADGTIERMLREGARRADIAQAFGLSASTVGKEVAFERPRIIRVGRSRVHPADLDQLVERLRTAGWRLERISEEPAGER